MYCPSKLVYMFETKHDDHINDCFWTAPSIHIRNTGIAPAGWPDYTPGIYIN